MQAYRPAQDQVFTDSRLSLSENNLFVALVGENHDAAKFVPELIMKGLQKAVVTDTQENKQLLSSIDSSKLSFVSDTTQYLQSIAKEKLSYWRALSTQNKVLAITGSNGKTSSKEMLAWILGGLKQKFHATRGNLNNHIGVPLTILEMPLECKTLVLEMGTNHPGEIELLCTIGDPDAGYITNVGQSHLEFFHNEDNVFVEKTALYRSIVAKDHGLFILNTDDTRLQKLKGEKHTVSIGADPANDITYADSDSAFSLCIEGKKLEFVCPAIPERHNRYNMAMALSLCLKLWPQKEVIEIFKARITEYTPPRNNRSVFLGNEDLTIYLDAYNANPSSMRASLEGFVLWAKNKNIALDKLWFILGDMNELGDLAPGYHKDIGELVSSLGIERVFFIGRFRDFYNQGYGGKAEVFSHRDEFIAKYSKAGKQWGCSAAFIKGSRTLQLEQLVDITLFPVL
tara:strand:+ start:10346 stop:11713 length:1368 start_codon:yes stop_codon:yes gene_type:complete